MRIILQRIAAVFILLCSPVTRALSTEESPPLRQQPVMDEMNAAIDQVKRIVNQPASVFARPPEALVAEFSPGWFHPGASKPKFAVVDVRKTQEFVYDRFEYVTSDLNPGLMFRGRDLEFNAMTKYFYTDRSVPKKRLSEEEMVEINRLYRIIGRCEQQLAPMQNAPVAASSESRSAPAVGDTASFKSYWLYVVALLFLLLLYRVHSRRKQETRPETNL